MNETPEPKTSLSKLERFRWNLLGDLAFEDTYAIWEVASRAHGAFPERTPNERRELAAEVLLELLAHGWAFLYRLQGLEPNVASERPQLRLEPGEALDYVSNVFRLKDATIVDDVWIAATEEGIRVANDPPLAVTKLWGWRV